MIIPGILENTLDEINNKIKLVEAASNYIQIDIADNKLVKGNTLTSIKLISQIKSNTKLELHLMAENPTIYLNEKMNFSKVSAQVEAEKSGEIDDYIKHARQLNLVVGLSIDPDTPNSALSSYVDQIDFVQFMGVIPGEQGRPFEYKVLEKIKSFKLSYPTTETQIDGHMDKEMINLVKNLGVDHFVVGSAIFNSADPVSTKKELDKILVS